MRELKIMGLTSVLFFSIIMVSALDGGFYYNIEVYYDKGGLSINKAGIEFSQEDLSYSYFEESTHVLKLRDVNNEILEEIPFFVSDLGYYDIVNETSGEIYDGGEIRLDNFTFDLYVPYHNNAKEFVIFEGESEIIGEDVSEFSKVRVEEGKEKAVGDFDKTDVFKERSKKSFSKYWVFWICLVVLICLLIYLLKRNKGKFV